MWTSKSPGVLSHCFVAAIITATGSCCGMQGALLRLSIYATNRLFPMRKRGLRFHGPCFLYKQELTWPKDVGCFLRDGQKVVIPVVEGIRALVAPTRYLALHCLDPAFLSEAVWRYSLDGDRLLIQFSDEIPLSLLTNGMVLHLTRLLLQPDFRSAWDALYFSLRQPGSARSSYPQPRLICPCPN